MNIQKVLTVEAIEDLIVAEMNHVIEHNTWANRPPDKEDAKIIKAAKRIKAYYEVTV